MLKYSSYRVGFWVGFFLFFCLAKGKGVSNPIGQSECQVWGVGWGVANCNRAYAYRRLEEPEIEVEYGSETV